ncbi:MAG: glycosyltransferase family 2 protein [Candidatus Eremiobacteraeota bacterium]|nr:glycosyltransferase family 2 protein [Candidatus Eremiobacteraeota bacterium]MBC5802148.1 glycosyltransferase family 2 protein [Candidatus Eremiobacteraeota bacterium]MBC5821725.1 glycosyltransferase family 2 protein [Candidatus Eremiobacteraeota bacterium]
MAHRGLWIVIPAYQEAAQIEATLSDLGAYLPRVVVVDDGSTDATAEAARRAGAEVLRHGVNLGQGAALQTGIDYALRSGATHICTFDADGQHDTHTIERLLDTAARMGADVVLGSRFSGAAVDMPPLRRLALRCAVLVTRMQTRLPLTDTHNGLRLFTREAALRIRIRQPGMAHASELLSTVARLGLHVVEVPTTVRYTAYSRAKGQRLSNSVKIALDLAYAALSS